MRLSAVASRRGWPPRAVVAVLVAGLVVRAVLVPITHGADFHVWDLASRATLQGTNIYAHHPAYSGGPFAYLPLFLDIELPLRWLALHTGVPFTILGKLPIVAGDMVVAATLALMARDRGAGAHAQALCAALFAFNPLVLYNGVFYGRFDSVCLALLVPAVRSVARRRTVTWPGAVALGAAIATKTFPVFLVPWFLRRRGGSAVRVVVACVGVVVVVCAPYLFTTPGPLVHDVLYSAGNVAGGLSWQVVLHPLPSGVQSAIGDTTLVLFAVIAIAAAGIDDALLAPAAILTAFLVLSKQVIEQYLLWPLPFLVLLALCWRSRPAWTLVAAVTAAGMVTNASVHPLGLQPAALNVALAVVLTTALVGLLFEARAGARRAEQDAEVPRDRIELSTPGFSDPCSTN